MEDNKFNVSLNQLTIMARQDLHNIFSNITIEMSKVLLKQKFLSRLFKILFTIICLLMVLNRFKEFYMYDHFDIINGIILISICFIDIITGWYFENKCQALIKNKNDLRTTTFAIYFGNTFCDEWKQLSEPDRIKYIEENFKEFL